jgi:hypothetical protein
MSQKCQLRKSTVLLFDYLVGLPSNDWKDAEMRAAVAGAGSGILASMCRKDRQIQMSPFQLFYILNLQ